MSGSRPERFQVAVFATATSDFAARHTDSSNKPGVPLRQRGPRSSHTLPTACRPDGSRGDRSTSADASPART